VKQIKEGKPLTVTDPNMTRFLMSLEDAVDLVVYAFQHGGQGDIFVQKAPASTIMDLAVAVRELFNASNPIAVIGTRHGEKLYETLLTREERSKAQDLEGYFRIAPDDRDLNYGKYFTEGEEKVSQLEDYNSHNTQRLDCEEVKRVLLQLKYIKKELEI
jgi:UDP-glucose 4-epimerase